MLGGRDKIEIEIEHLLLPSWTQETSRRGRTTAARRAIDGDKPAKERPMSAAPPSLSDNAMQVVCTIGGTITGIITGEI